MAKMCYEISEIYEEDGTQYIFPNDTVFIQDSEYLNQQGHTGYVHEIQATALVIQKAEYVDNNLWHYTVKANNKEYTIIDDDIKFVVRDV